MTIFYRNRLDRSRLCQRNRCIVLLWSICWHCTICCVINDRTGGRCDRHLRAVWKLVSTGDRRNVAGVRSCDLTIAGCQNRIAWSDRSDVKINLLTGAKCLLRLKLLQWVIICAIDTILIAHPISICQICHLHNIYGSAIVWSYTHIKLNCFLLWRCALISGFCRPGVVARVYRFRCEQSTRYTHGWHDRSCGNPQGQDFCQCFALFWFPLFHFSLSHSSIPPFTDAVIRRLRNYFYYLGYLAVGAVAFWSSCSGFSLLIRSTI